MLLVLGIVLPYVVLHYINPPGNYVIGEGTGPGKVVATLPMRPQPMSGRSHVW
jgi:hypothetical protein